MKPVRLLDAAAEDLSNSTAWYEEQSEGLGEQLSAAVLDAIERIRERPAAFPKAGRSHRRAVLGGFPYAVVFEERPEEILIVAVAHAKRRPGFWTRRH